MDWDQAERLVDAQIGYWSHRKRYEWVQALEQCLAQAKRCQTMQEVIVDLRQRLERAEKR
jgi:hypothetical protein